MDRRTTLKDVARATNLSSSTISFAINGRAKELRIPQETSDRARYVALKMNWRPNQNARDLRSSLHRRENVYMVDVAKEVGVSQTTVSFALRGMGSASQETVRKIREAAVKLGYPLDVSDSPASKLKTGKLKTREDLSF